MSWQAFINNIGPSPWSSEPYWRKINEIRHKRKSRNISTLTNNDKVLSTDKEKAEAFRKKLSSSSNESSESSKDFNEAQKAFVDNITFKQNTSNF